MLKQITPPLPNPPKEKKPPVVQLCISNYMPVTIVTWLQHYVV